MGEITSVINDTQRRRMLKLRSVRLRVVEGPDAGLERTFERDVIRIGSQEGNDIQLSDSTVSRFHAEIARTPNGVLIRDLNSTNGTFVGPVRVREVYLADQRRIRVGKTAMDFLPEEQLIEIRPAAATRFEGLVGQSIAMREVFSMVERVAPTELTVLVTGETGTGKELLSRAIHNRSSRKNGPFVVLDCGAVPRNLVEAELFGNERGAFTGAVAPRAGVFEQANGGTIFLDELGELPLEVQSTLLRVLEQREVRRLGDRRVRRIDVRVIAATNRDLREEVAEGRFREDLYYRLAVVELELPALRDRQEDVGILADHLLATAPFEHTVQRLSEEVLTIFRDWRWPGNVRELRNVVLRALPFCMTEEITLDALPEALRKQTAPTDTKQKPHGEDLALPRSDLSFREAKDEILQAFERRYLEELLERCEGNISRAAREAGIDRKTIARLIKRHQIRRPS